MSDGGGVYDVGISSSGHLTLTAESQEAAREKAMEQGSLDDLDPAITVDYVRRREHE